MSDYSEAYIGCIFGYYKILQKSGKNSSGQQLYLAHCMDCGGQFEKVIYAFKRAAPRTQCPHRKMVRHSLTKEHPCLYCGDTTTNPSYCSPGCRTAAMNHRIKRKEPLRCLVCGHQTAGRRQLLCSDECRRIYRFKKQSEVQSICEKK